MTLQGNVHRGFAIAIVLVVALPARAADDDHPEFRPFARLHVDAGAWHTDARDSDMELRRARMGARGRLTDELRYRFELDVIGMEFDPIDFWLQWRPADSNGRLTVGHQQVPIGLDAMRGSERLFFLERALPTALVPGYRFGAQWQYRVSKRSGFTVGAFGDRLRSFDEFEVDLDGERRLTARWSQLFEINSNISTHVGLAFDFQHPEDETARFRARPESRLGRLRFVDTGRIDDARSITASGLEFAVFGNRWSVSGERVETRVGRKDASELGFHGWSASFVWTFADDTWRYNRLRGRLSGRPPIGVWSLGIRFSAIDLDDGEIRGGNERNVTVSAARRLTKAARFLVEVADSRGTDRRGDAIAYSKVQLRLQLWFR